MSTDINYYTGLLTSEHRGQPKLTALLTAFIEPFVAQQIVLNAMPQQYDLDSAVGVQLDAVGLWIGASRFVPDVPYTGGTLTKLNDYYYRILLKGKIFANHWDGTIPGAYNFWYQLLGKPLGLTILIKDNDDMTMNVTLVNCSDVIVEGLFLAGLLFVKPMGVKVIYVVEFVPPP